MKSVSATSDEAPQHILAVTWVQLNSPAGYYRLFIWCRWLSIGPDCKQLSASFFYHVTCHIVSNVPSSEKLKARWQRGIRNG